MIDNYTMFVIFSTLCIIIFLIGTGKIIKDILLDYLYSDIEEDEDTEEDEMLLDMLYD